MWYDLATFMKGVDTYTTDAITQGQYDALVSFSYNLGLNSLKTSTLLKKVNNNPQDPTIQDEFLKWKFAGGEALAGLLKRRKSEA